MKSRRTYPARHASKRVVSKFPSLKANRIVRVTSLLARDLLYLLEFDPEIVTYTENVPPIAYQHMGRHCEYAFDFLLECSDRKLLVKLLRIGEQPQFQPRLRAICEKEGYELVVFTEEYIHAQPRLDNVKLLTRYARLSVAPHHLYTCHSFFTLSTSPTLGDLMEFFDTEGLERQSVLALLYHRMLIFDLMIPLSLQIPISLPKKAAARKVV